MEENVLLWIQNNMRSDILTLFLKFITMLGDAGAVWIFIAVLLLIFRKTRKVGIISTVSLVTSFIFNNLILKNVFARPRPYEVIPGLTALIPHPHDFSFPSGHAAASFAVAAVIYITVPKKYGVPALVLAILIAFSRLYLGVHYPTDVLFGILSGTVIAAISVQMFNRTKTKLYK